MPDQSMPEPSPSFLALLKNRVQELFGGQPGTAGAHEAYSRLTRRPMYMAGSEQQAERIGPGNYGSTFLHPGDVGMGGGPLAELVREQLPSGPVTVLNPALLTEGKEGVPTHESMHQYLGEEAVSPEVLLKALPKETADRLRTGLKNLSDKAGYSAGNIPGELAARVLSSGAVTQGADFMKSQGATIGLTDPAEAKLVRETYLKLLAKQDPKKAARLASYTSGSSTPFGTKSGTQYVASLAKRNQPSQ